jgi:hypothetical protein
MLIWLLPTVFFILLGIARLLIPDVVLAAALIAWLFGSMWASRRIHASPAGAIRHYVRDIEQVKGAYRVLWMMDIVYFPAVILTVIGVVTFAESSPSPAPRILVTLVIVSVCLWLMYRFWTRVSGFRVADDGAVWIQRAGREELLSMTAFRQVQGISTSTGRYNDAVMAHRIRFSQHENGQRSVLLSLMAVRSRQFGTPVSPAVVETFFTRHLESAGFTIHPHQDGWMAAR